MQVVLIMLRGDGERRSFSVTRDMTVIGRREDCDLRIPVGDVSRKHCRLVKNHDVLRIEDLGSSNGTYVNSERTQEAVLQPGDWIQVGPVQFVIQIDGSPTEDELSRPPSPVPEATTAGEQVISADAITQDSLDKVPAEEADELANLEEVSELADLEEVPADELVAGEADLEELTELEEVPEEPPVKAKAPEKSRPAAKPPSVAKVPAGPTPPPLPATPLAAEEAEASDGEWNFVVEEGESSQSHIDLNIDLDAAHEQPHGHA